MSANYEPESLSAAELQGKQIQSVQRAINILNCFTATSPALTLSQISGRLGLNKGTVHGILNTLRANGYISQNSFGQYMLGAELFNKFLLAGDTRRHMCIDHAHELMQKLSNQYQANASLFSVEDGRLQVMDTAVPTNCTFILRRAVSEIPVYGSASGKLLLAHLNEKELNLYLAGAPFPALTPLTNNTRQKLLENLIRIRENRYSYEQDELFMGISALAVPVYAHSVGKLFATLSLTGLSVNIAKNKRPIIKSLTDAAHYLQQVLRF